jgi:hypothetical protein
MDQIATITAITKNTIWEHVLFGKGTSEVSIISELDVGELSKLLEMLPMMADIFRSPIGCDDSASVKRYLFDKLAEYDENDSEKLYHIPNHSGFKFLQAFIRDGKIEDGVETFIHRMHHDMHQDIHQCQDIHRDYNLMMYWITNFYNARLLPLYALQTINYSIYEKLKSIFIVYFELGVIGINSEYFISYSSFMQMPEKKQIFVSTYFYRHNYLMSGKSIDQFMIDQLLTITDLLSMDDNNEYEPQICVMVRNRTL